MTGTRTTPTGPTPPNGIGGIRSEVLGFVTVNAGTEQARIVSGLLDWLDGMKHELLMDLTGSLRREYLRGHEAGYAKAINEMAGES